MSSVSEFLKSVVIFNHLQESSLKTLADLLAPKSCAEDEVIFREDEQCSELYILRQGKIKLGKHKYAAGTPGDELVLMVRPKDIFGEFAFIDGRCRSATATAIQPSEVLILSREAFERFAEQDPHAAFIFIRNIAVIIADRLRETDALWLGG